MLYDTANHQRGIIWHKLKYGIRSKITSDFKKLSNTLKFMKLSNLRKWKCFKQTMSVQYKKCPY